MWSPRAAHAIKGRVGTATLAQGPYLSICSISGVFDALGGESPPMWKPWESEGREVSSVRCARGLGLLLLSASGPLNMLLPLADTQFPCFAPSSYPFISLHISVERLLLDNLLPNLK